jgi:hypothetical protein
MDTDPSDNVPKNVRRQIEGPRIPCLSCRGDLLETCPWDDFGEEIVERGQELVDSGSTPSQVRFQSYRLATNLIHGYLGRANRKELPACVEDSIKEAFKNTTIDEEGFVGFRPAPKSDADECIK